MLRIAAVVVVLAFLSGCSGTDDELTPPTTTKTVTPPAVPDVPKIPVAANRIGANTLVWAQGSSLHVGAKVVDVSPLHIERYVVAAGGVYFVARDQVWFTDLTKVSPTGLTRVDDLTLSPDRRDLGLIDYSHGPKDRHGTRLAAVVVYDVRTGDRVVQSFAGMGSIRKDDLANLYQDATPTALGFNGNYFFATTAKGSDRYSYPLDGGAPTNLGEQSDVVDASTGIRGPDYHAVRKGGRVVLSKTDLGTYSAVVSPDETTGLFDSDSSAFKPFTVATGLPIRLSLGGHSLFDLGGWSADGSFFGVVNDGTILKHGKRFGIWSCDPRKGRCRDVVPERLLDHGTDVLFGTGELLKGD